MCNIWSLCGCIVDYVSITGDKVATALVCLTYNRSSPTAHISKKCVRYLRTIIVIADIDRGLYSLAVRIMQSTMRSMSIAYQYEYTCECNTYTKYLYFILHHVLHDAYDPPYLTFRHWSGVTLYTSTYVFAESCVFVKQSPGNLSLRPQRTTLDSICV